MTKPEWKTDAPDKPHYEWDYKPGDAFMLYVAADLMRPSAKEPAKGGLTELLNREHKKANRFGL